MKHSTLQLFITLLSTSIIAQSVIAQGDSTQAAKADNDLLDFSLIDTDNNDIFGDFDSSLFEEKASLPFDISDLENSLPDPDSLSRDEKIASSDEVSFGLDELATALAKTTELPETAELPKTVEVAKMIEQPELPEQETPKVLPRFEDSALEPIELSKDITVERVEKLASQVVVQQPVEDVSDNFDGVISGTSLPETKIELLDPIQKGVVAICQSDKEGKFGFTNVKTEKGKGKPYRLHFPEKQMKAPSFTLSESSPYHHQKNIFGGAVPKNKPKVCIEDKK